MSAEASTQENDPPRQGPLRTLWGRFEHLIRELGKFGVVGGTSFIVDTVVFNLALSAVGSLWAKVISTCVSATLAFLGNRYWTWRDRPRSALHREYTLYFAFNVVGLFIGLACLWASHYGLGHFWPDVFHTRLADNLSAQIVGTAAGTLFRFWTYRRFVFPAVRDPAPNAAAG